MPEYSFSLEHEPALPATGSLELETPERQKVRERAAADVPTRQAGAKVMPIGYDRRIGKINVNEIFPMGEGGVRIDDSRDFFRNPRDFTELSDQQVDELAQDIKENEMYSPIWVRPAPRGWELIAGQRRLTAHKLAGKKQILARVFEVGPTQAMEMAIAEETHKKGWSPIARGRAYIALQKLYQEEIDRVYPLIEHLKSGHKFTNANRALAEGILDKARLEGDAPISKAVRLILTSWMENASPNNTERPVASPTYIGNVQGVSGNHIQQLVRLAEAKPEVQKEIHEQNLGIGYARIVTRLEEPVQQMQLLRSIKNKKLSLPQAADEARGIAGRAKVRVSHRKNNAFQDAAEIEFVTWDAKTLTYNLDLWSDMIDTVSDHLAELRADAGFDKTVKQASQTRLTRLMEKMEKLRGEIGK